jgi:hypothetical protein
MCNVTTHNHHVPIQNCYRQRHRAHSGKGNCIWHWTILDYSVKFGLTWGSHSTMKPFLFTCCLQFSYQYIWFSFVPIFFWFKFICHFYYYLGWKVNKICTCKIWGFHSSDYEECHLLGYKTPVRTSGDTLRLSYRVQSVNAMKDLRFLQQWLWRMSSSGLLHHVALVRTDILEERIASVIRVTRIGELGTLAVTSNWRMLRTNTWYFFAACICC